MGPLRSRRTLCRGDGDRLGAQQTHECASGRRPTPITPQDRLRWGSKLTGPLWRWRWPFHWPYDSAHAAGPLGLGPLTLMPHSTPTAIGQSCCVEDAHCAVAFRAACLGIERVPCWTAQRAIWLRIEVGCSELSCAFCMGKGGWSIDERSGLLAWAMGLLI
jgi:hypothetical protein